MEHQKAVCLCPNAVGILWIILQVEHKYRRRPLFQLRQIHLPMLNVLFQRALIRVHLIPLWNAIFIHGMYGVGKHRKHLRQILRPRFAECQLFHVYFPFIG